jgi:hypothetical protein
VETNISALKMIGSICVVLAQAGHSICETMTHTSNSERRTMAEPEAGTDFDMGKGGRVPLGLNGS